jgi:transcription elongation GreA/GreB family factor
MSLEIINKKTVVSLVINELESELKHAVNSANDAHAAAVDDESVAETQYDTLAIEAGYLAEGQSRRVQELHSAIQSYQSLPLITFDQNKAITLSALVQLSQDKGSNHWFFIGPAAGGFRCQIAKQHITVITPQSPMGKALINKFEDDDIEVMLGQGELNDYIEKVQ